MTESKYSVQYYSKHVIPYYSKSSQGFFPAILFKTAKISLCLYARVNVQIFLIKVTCSRHLNSSAGTSTNNSAAKVAEGKKNLDYLNPFLFFTCVSRILLLLLS